MTSIERTAYPRFGRLVSARELTGMSPSVDEVIWARSVARSDSHLLALVLSLKCFQRLGYFPRRGEVPDVVTEHMRRCLDLAEGTKPEVGSERTGTSQHQLVRERVGVVLDPERARTVAGEAIRSAAEVKNNPPDLINVALEMLVKASLELPGFSTLDTMTSQIRTEVNTALFEGIAARVPLGEARGLEALLDVAGPSRTSGFHRLKQAAGRASWSALATWPGSTPSATRRRGWRAWPSPRSPTSPARRGRRMPRSWARSAR